MTDHAVADAMVRIGVAAVVAIASTASIVGIDTSCVEERTGTDASVTIWLGDNAGKVVGVIAVNVCGAVFAGVSVSSGAGASGSRIKK